jgi:hypothetical protein
MNESHIKVSLPSRCCAGSGLIRCVVMSDRYRTSGFVMATPVVAGEAMANGNVFLKVLHSFPSSF